MKPINTLVNGKALSLVMVVRRYLNSIGAYQKRHPLLHALVASGFIFLILFAASWYKSYDPDFGWHVRAGQDIAANGIPLKDPYTYTAQDFAWINHEWLADVILWGLYSSLGYFGLSLVYTFLWGGALLLSKAYKSITIGSLAALAVIPYAGVRAMSWTVFFFSIFLRLCLAPSWKVRALVVPLIGVWANMHGGFAIALAVLAYFAVWRRDPKWLLILAGGILVSFINPYGPRLYEEIIRTLMIGSVRWQIVEWFPASFVMFPMAFLYSAVWALGFLVHNGKPSLRYLQSVSLIVFAAALSSNRHFPLFVVASVAESIKNLGRLKKAVPPQLSLAKSIMAALPVVVVVCLVALNTFTTLVTAARGNVQEISYPSRAVAYLSDNPCDGNVFAFYNYGGYLIWKLPEAPVYIDGRGPLWKDEEGVLYFNRYNAIKNDENAVNGEEFRRYNIRCVLWPTTKSGPPMIESIKKAGWQKVDEASNEWSTLWRAPAPANGQ